MVHEVLEKSSLATADRPPMHFAERITGGLSLEFLPYSELIFYVNAVG